MTEHPGESFAAPGPTGPATGTPWPYGPARSAPVGLAIASAVIAVGLAFVEVATALSAGQAADEFRDAIRDGQTSNDVFTLYDALELLLFPIMVAAYVVSCLWLHFARSNSLVIDPSTRHRRRTIWVWLGWWVPIVSLWFPYQVVRDVQDGSRSARGRAPVGLGLWWTAWLVYVIGSQMTSRASTSDDPDVVGTLPVLEGITAVAVVVACVTWCRLVQNITSMQQEALAPR